MSEPIQAAAETAELHAWLGSLGRDPREIHPLPGDVSPRRYFRAVFADGGSAILATYPAAVREICPRFLRTSELLAEGGVRVPQVFGSDCEAGWMLIEDLGPQALGDWGKGRPWNELAAWFEHALEIAGRISRLPAERIAGLNPPLGTELMTRELAQSWDLFLEAKGLVNEPELAADLRVALDAICRRLGSAPRVPCHRDFMVRNLMPLPATGELAVLDHQDLRLGPPLYDVASLLNDTLLPPPATEAALLAAVLSSSDERESYHRAAAQRTLKAVGTYASFARRGVRRHLPLIAPTLARFVSHLSRLPEGERLAPRLAESWREALQSPES